MPVAYSYLRFSSQRQADGDSLRRQAQNRERWIAAHPGVSLDTSLVLEDRGRSAFKRDKWDTYALARFVDCVKSGRVEPGSYLLVEDLDRLSREEAGEATELFLSIVNKGIVIVQLSPEVTQFKKPVDMLSLMRAILELSRGHSESAIKSERCRAAWERKNAEAASRLVTKRLPGWVRQIEGGRLALDPDAARTVRRIFKLIRDGFSVRSVAQTLNAEGVPVIGRKVLRGRTVCWSAPTIRQILTSRSAVGEYVPYHWTKRGDKPAADVVPNYYPPLIDEASFQAARAAMATRGQVGRGRKGKHVNLFAGLLRDARNGDSLCYVHRRTGCYLLPVPVVHGKGGGWVSFPGAVFEQAILKELREVRASDVEVVNDAGQKVEAIAGEHADAEQKVRWYKAKCDAAATEEDFNIFAPKVVEWERRRKELAAKLAGAQREAASPAAETWGEFRTLADLLAKDDGDELRTRVRAALRRAVDGVYCLFVTKGAVRLAAVRIEFKGGSGRDYLINYTPGRSNQNIKRPPSWGVASFASSGLPALDLRKAADVAKAEKVLASIAEALAGS